MSVFTLVVYALLLLIVNSEQTAGSDPTKVCPETQLANAFTRFNDICYYATDRDNCSDILGSNLPQPRTVLQTSAIEEFMAENDIPDTTIDINPFLTDWHWTEDATVVSAQGCYMHTQKFQYSTVVATMTPDSCKRTCRSLSYKIAAVQNGNNCHCNMTWNPYLLTSGDKCTVKCSGDELQLCGGQDSYYAYHISDTVQDFNVWTRGNPSSNRDTENCVYVQYDRSLDDATHVWKTGKCSERLQYVCGTKQGLNSKPCKPYQKQINDVCVTITWKLASATSWHKAKLRCENLGGSLLSIRDQAFNGKLSNTLFLYGSEKRFWVGLTNVVWTWGRVNALSDAYAYGIKETSWSSKTILNISDSVCTFLDSRTHYWTRKQCSLNQSHKICQKDAQFLTTTTTTEPTTTTVTTPKPKPITPVPTKPEPTTTRKPTTTSQLTTSHNPTTTSKLTTSQNPPTTQQLPTSQNPSTTHQMPSSQRPWTTESVLSSTTEYSATSASPQSQSQSSNGFIYAITGAAIGVWCLVIILVVFLIIYIRKKRRQRSDNNVRLVSRLPSRKDLANGAKYRNKPMVSQRYIDIPEPAVRYGGGSFVNVSVDDSEIYCNDVRHESDVSDGDYLVPDSLKNHNSNSGPRNQDNPLYIKPAKQRGGSAANEYENPDDVLPPGGVENPAYGLNISENNYDVITNATSENNTQNIAMKTIGTAQLNTTDRNPESESAYDVIINANHVASGRGTDGVVDDDEYSYVYSAYPVAKPK
ncbi:uncharacterized protein LOC141907258 [Tubulanus polymorphus]|uniref:uncharacterized protein LOC141907258 n=1 Tax=Tubulanus polymorphus TaxID=672921 RepID=UPI003DA1E5B1